MISKQEKQSMIADEDKAYKYYMKKYRETGDETFLEIANQEAWHRDYWTALYHNQK